MTRVVARSVVDRAGLEAFLRPRTDVLREEPVGDGRFVQGTGPFRRYERRVEHQPAAAAADTAADGAIQVTQTVDFDLAIPYFGFLFRAPMRWALARAGRERPPFWAPPDPLDPRAAAALGTLALLAVVFGYLGTLFTHTISFAGDEFGAGNSAQGLAGSVVRMGGLLALVVLAAADRRGRRAVILATATAGCLMAATGALAPTLPWLAGSQMVARAFATALLILVGIVAAEEVPAGSRAYAVSLLAMAGGLGAGICILSLRLADLGPQGWRLLYLIPLLGLPAVAGARRRLSESRRFLAPHPRSDLAGHGGRLLLLATSAFLLNLFIAPQSQFGNRYLRTEQGLSGGQTGLFIVLAGTPASIGIIAGGRIADVRGRRAVGAVALAGGTAFTVTYFLSDGWPIFLWAMLGNVLYAASVPALGVYGPELFPTSLRGRANGVVTVTGLAGSAIGLVSAGVMSDAFGAIGPAMAVLGAGPLVLALLVVAFYPETAHRELEDINPEDRPPPPPAAPPSPSP